MVFFGGGWLFHQFLQATDVSSLTSYSVKEISKQQDLGRLYEQRCHVHSCQVKHLSYDDFLVHVYPKVSVF